MNTVGSFPSLYTFQPPHIQKQREEISPFQIQFCTNDDRCGGWRSIVSTQAFGRQQAQSVNHFSAHISFVVLGRKKHFCLIFL